MENLTILFFPMTVYDRDETPHIPCYYPSSSDRTSAYDLPFSDVPSRKRKRLKDHPTSEERVNLYLSKDSVDTLEPHFLSDEELRDFCHTCFMNQWRINISNTALRRNTQDLSQTEKIINKYKSKLDSGQLNFQSRYDWNKVYEIRNTSVKKSLDHFEEILQSKRDQLHSLKIQCSKLPRVCLEMLLESKMAERGIAEYEILMAEREYGRRDFSQHYYYELELRMKELKKKYQTKLEKIQGDYESRLLEYKNHILLLKKTVHTLENLNINQDSSPFIPLLDKNSINGIKYQRKSGKEYVEDRGPENNAHSTNITTREHKKTPTLPIKKQSSVMELSSQNGVVNKEFEPTHGLDVQQELADNTNSTNEASVTKLKAYKDEAPPSPNSLKNNPNDDSLRRDPNIDLSHDDGESSASSEVRGAEEYDDTRKMDNFLDFPRKQVLDKEVYGLQNKNFNLLEKGGELGVYQILLNDLKKTGILSPHLIDQLLWLDETNANRCIEAPSQDTFRDGQLYVRCLRLEIRLREKIEKVVRKAKKLRNKNIKFSEMEKLTIQEEIMRDNRELYKSTLKLDNGRNNLQKTLKLHYAQINSRWNNFPPLKRGYRLLNMLGKGGFAEVWEVFDPLTCTIFAAKLHMLPPDMSYQERNEVIKRVKNEIDIHKVCRSNSHIVDMKACFQMDENLLATILELCEDGDLDKYIKFHGPIPEDLALVWTKQILTGLYHMKHLTEGRVHHCDLKPGNILRHRGILKLSDFGLSKMVKPNTESYWTGGGTAWYQAPECCFYNKKTPLILSDKIDIWAIGCILFEMLFAQRLFGGSHTIHKPMDKILEDAKLGIKFPDHPKISNECEQFILLLLKFDHTERPSIEDTLEHPLIANAENYKEPNISKLSF